MNITAYKMIERELQALDSLVRSVEEVVHREPVCLVHGLWLWHMLDHWPNNDVRVDHCQIEVGIFNFHEVPCGFLGQLLRNVVGRNGIVIRNCISSRYLVLTSVVTVSRIMCNVPGSNPLLCNLCQLHSDLRMSLGLPRHYRAVRSALACYLQVYVHT
jgi:arginine/lysine/ornithine decarboxylase